MSTGNIFIYIVLPTLGWIVIRIGKIERKLTALCARCDLHLKVRKPSTTDTDRYLPVKIMNITRLLQLLSGKKTYLTDRGHLHPALRRVAGLVDGPQRSLCRTHGARPGISTQRHQQRSSDSTTGRYRVPPAPAKPSSGPPAFPLMLFGLATWLRHVD